MSLLRPFLILAGLVLAWQGIVTLAETPHYILPGPGRVAAAWLARAGLILGHAGTTVAEILLGLLAGALLGIGSAILVASFRPVRR